MGTPRRVLIATTNPGKQRELARLLMPLGVEVITLADLAEVPSVVEDQATFEGNARKKAREIAEVFSGMVLADDSGLVVDALNGAPGVYSARYAGPEANDERNNRKLLQALEGVPTERRTARFVCVVAFADPEGSLGAELHLERGTCEGHIGLTPRGGNGFGYDPLFVPRDSSTRVDLENSPTMAELPPEEKARRSHRGAAMGALRDWLEVYWNRAG